MKLERKDIEELTSSITQEVLKAVTPVLGTGHPSREMDHPADKGAGLNALRNELPESGLLRLWQIIGDRRRGVRALLPISKSSWWAGVKAGRYPKPVKLSPRCTCWRVEDIRALLESLAT